MIARVCRDYPRPGCLRMVYAGTRCRNCIRERHRVYEGDYPRRCAETIAAEPWCHWPGGCDYRITERNPLTCNHKIPVVVGRGDGPLEPMCMRHNSGLGARRT